jgi:1,6-anhydro-N-acetylmuramate kinase
MSDPAIFADLRSGLCFGSFPNYFSGLEPTSQTTLAGHVSNAVVPVEAIGLNGDVIEAEAWAYMAVRSMMGLPITFPETTGAPSPMTGGVLAKAPT